MNEEEQNKQPELKQEEERKGGPLKEETSNKPEIADI
jgi:hypothetical protein